MANRGGWRSGQRAFAFGDADTGLGHPSEVQRNLSADLNPVLIPAVVAEPAKPSRRELPPVWWQRVWLVLYVLFCAELGMLLITLPWRTIWRTNRFLADYPALRIIFENNFVRGMVTGIGVVDLFLGASAAVHFAVHGRERNPVLPAEPASPADSRSLE